MIIIKLIGGAKKIFSTEKIELGISNSTIEDILKYLKQIKPEETPIFDEKNIIIAVNGADSSTMQGKKTQLNEGDVVSIIPIIHGGSNQLFSIGKTHLSIFELRGNDQINHDYLDYLRKKFPSLKIQAVSSKFILNSSHLKKILTISLEAQKRKILLSEKLETDILLRIAGTTQISQAINDTGIKPGLNIIILALGKKGSLEILYSEINQFVIPFHNQNYSKTFLKKRFGISKKHLESVNSKEPLEDLLAERAAILV